MGLLLKNLGQFMTDDNGLEVVEYAIIMGLIVVATITALGILGAWVLSQYENVNTQVGAGT